MAPQAEQLETVAPPTRSHTCDVALTGSCHQGLRSLITESRSLQQAKVPAREVLHWSIAYAPAALKQSAALSGGFGEFVEYCDESHVLMAVGPAFVVAATQVLDERMTTDHY